MSEITEFDNETTLDVSRYQRLSSIPPEVEWFANLQSEHTRRSYKRDVQDFMLETHISKTDEIRGIKRSHVIFYRDLCKRRGESDATIRRRLSANSSLFDYLCEKDCVPTNPVKGIQRPNSGANEG